MWKGGNKNKKPPQQLTDITQCPAFAKLLIDKEKTRRTKAVEKKKKDILYISWGALIMEGGAGESHASRRSLWHPTHRSWLCQSLIARMWGATEPETRDDARTKGTLNTKKRFTFSFITCWGGKKKKKEKTPPTGVVKAKSQMFAKSTFQIHFDLQVTSLSGTQTEAIQFIH